MIAPIIKMDRMIIEIVLITLNLDGAETLRFLLNLVVNVMKCEYRLTCKNEKLVSGRDLNQLRRLPNRQRNLNKRERIKSSEMTRIFRCKNGSHIYVLNH